MASLGIQLGGNRCLDLPDNLCSSSFNQSARPCPSMMVRCHDGSRGRRKNSMVAMARGSLEVMGRERRRGSGNSSETAALAYEKLDEWMRDSVVEIVKNLREAPLLVHVYGNSSLEEKPRLETEKGVEEENWDVLKRKWEGGVAPLPDGVIFVEELTGGDEDNSDGNGDVDGGGDGITRAWGLVVQGKGEESGPACYLLKTSKVNTGSGCGLSMGLGCTHFCLVRVNSFRETAQSQLKNCWLLQAQAQ